MGDTKTSTRRSKRHKVAPVAVDEPMMGVDAASTHVSPGPSADAEALAEARDLIATLREKETQQDRNIKVMDRNLMIMQRHLSEERARVAELHGRLLGRSAGAGDRDEVRAQMQDHVNSGEGPPPGCPAHAQVTPEPPRGCPMHAHAGDKRGAPEPTTAAAETTVRNLRQESFKEEPMALSSLKELAMDSVLEGVTIADFSLPDQPLIYANHGFEEITGYSIEETVGHNCRFLQGPNTEPEKLAHIRRCISSGLPCTVQIKNYRKTGEEFINYLSLTPIRTARGRVTHYVGIQSDITELVNTRSAELDALKKATVAEAATDAKSKFLAHMSHEIRTPLNGLIAVGQLLEDTSLNRIQQDYVSTIRSSGETLQALIADILDFSRVEADKLVLRKEPFNPQAVLATVIKIVGLHSARLKLNIGYHLDENVPELVIGDAMRVQQVILNTINNAIKFTEKGDIMIRMYVGKRRDAEEAFHRSNRASCESENAEEKEPETRQSREEATRIGMSKARERATLTDWLDFPKSLAADADGPSTSGGSDDKTDGDDDMALHFYVKDTGIGLSSSSVSTIFNSFQQVDLSPTRKYDGTGLGLAISQRLCEAMGGRMWAESPGLGMGSTFHFSIRCEPVVQEAVDKAAEAAPVPGGARGCPIEAKKEAAARLAVRASGATTTTVKSMVRTPSMMTFGTICAGRELRVLLYDESKMMRQTLTTAIKRWGVNVITAATGDDLVAALDAGASCDAKSAPYDIIVAEKSKTFVKAVRRWAESKKQIATRKQRDGPSDKEAGGSVEGNADQESTPTVRCPKFILLTWPGYARSDSGDGLSWGNIEGLSRASLDNLNSHSGSDAETRGALTEVDEEVDEFLNSKEAEIMPKPVQHARLQKLLATVATDLFSSAETNRRTGKDTLMSAKTAGTGQSAESQQVAERSSAFKPLPSKLRILLAEDHHINMKVACAVLAKCGHKDVTIAKDGVEVLDKLTELPNGLDSFDIVLMDLHMPRMGGMECVRQLRETYQDSKVPIVAVTADAVEESREKCLKNGFTAWISKPFRVEQLAGLLDEYSPAATGAHLRAGGG
ncbi:response regulator [bacterium]|nr:response regulator [bacterium]|tara:strand:- start:16157 stop:19378 length:3222 start_codon:yes stop_codon:yes gene_type:complete